MDAGLLRKKEEWDQISDLENVITKSEMIHKAQGIIVAGMQSSSGKTAVTCMLLSALRARGIGVQPFKVGPDFIDTGYHMRYAGVPSRNLDTWLMNHDQILAEVSSHTMGKIGIIEGVMGLFDGGNATSDEGSAMELARWLGWPVILVVPAAKTGRSVAAALRGFIQEAGEDRICGIILNQVSGPSHIEFLKEAIVPLGIPVLGAIPQCEALRWPERHLGLQAHTELRLPEEAELAKLAESFLDVAAIINCASLSKGCCAPASDRAPASENRLEYAGDLCVAVARDEAFHFYYEGNLDFLRQRAEVIEFSPLHDASLPSGVDAIVFGGGFPEMFASQLASNERMRTSIRSAILQGLPCYAECGGLMYLADELISLDGLRHPMAGVIPGAVEMTRKLVNFGYCEAKTSDGSYRGHEFHYSQWHDEKSRANLWQVARRRGGPARMEGFHTENLHASYMHLYWQNSAPIFDRLFQGKLQGVA